MPTVLVVDDDRNIRSTLGRLLKRRGYDFVLCESAEEADRTIPEHSVDVLLLDLRMPGMDGYTFLRQLHRDHGRIPVIILTGSGTMDDAITAVRLRASDFLQKPFDDDELLAAIETAIEGRASQSSGEIPAYRGAPSDGAAAQSAATDASQTRRAVQTVLAALKEIDRLLGLKRIELPVLDARVGRIQNLGHRHDCGVDEVLDVIGHDQALAATCLRAANSAIYGTSHQIKSLRQACIQLGNRRVMAFASESLAQGVFIAGREPFDTILARLWRNAIVTARVIEHLARQAYRTVPLARMTLPGLDELHVAALLHNVGELLMLRLLAQLEGFSIPNDVTLAVLGEAINARHESYGGKLAQRWGLPKLVCFAAGSHHRPATAPETDGEALLRNLILAAWAMALRGGHTYLPAPPPPDPAEFLAAVGLDPDGFDQLYEQMDGWLDAVG